MAIGSSYSSLLCLLLWGITIIVSSLIGYINRDKLPNADDLLCGRGERETQDKLLLGNSFRETTVETGGFCSSARRPLPPGRVRLEVQAAPSVRRSNNFL